MHVSRLLRNESITVFSSRYFGNHHFIIVFPFFFFFLSIGGVEFIPSLRTFGATAHLLEMLRKHRTHSEFVTWKVLVALNNIVFKDCAETAFLVSKGLIELLLPLCGAESKRVRLQTLWIIGNAAVQPDENIEKRVFTSSVVEAIVKVNLHHLFLLGRFI